MATLRPATPSGSAGERREVVPPGVDAIAFGLLLLGFVALYGPTYLWLAQNVWSTDEQGHGPIILALSLYLLYAKRRELVAEFDHVVVDTPAAAHGRDGAVIAARCGAALLVARRHKASAAALQDLVARLSENRATIAGAVLNEA